VIDSGVDPSQPDMAGAVSTDSTDIVAGRNLPAGEPQNNKPTHGTLVAGVIGSRFNGFGTIGVAYDSSILSIRADTAGSCANTTGPDSGCSFGSTNLANAIDYARTHGARVINLSLGGPGQESILFEQALSRAVSAGIVVAASAGNDSGADPDYPARYAVDGRFGNGVVAVGAVNSSSSLSSFSNKAGVAAQGYLVAPGEKVVTACDRSGDCWQFDGTSAAAPHVSGALALLLQAFPNLTGQDAVRLLFDTATDLGDPGVDPVYGHGLVNLQRAFQPVGTLSVPTSAQTTAAAMTVAGATLGAAFGDAVSRTTALTTVGFDSYRRMFRVNLADGYPSAPQGLLGGAVGPLVQDSEVAVAPARGVALTLAGGFARDLLPPPLRNGRLPWAETGRSDLSLRLDAGRFSFQTWRGGGGMAPAGELAAAANAFAAMSRPEHALRAGYALGKGLFVSAETGGSSGADTLGFAQLKPSSYALASLAAVRGRFAATVTAGSLDEPEGPLGSMLPQLSDFALPARTAFAGVRADFAAAGPLVLSAEGNIGRTRAAGALMRLGQPAISTNWRLTAWTRCLAGASGCTSFHLQLEQPTRIESGTFSAVLADLPAAYGDPVAFSRRSFSAAPSGRELDLRLGMSRAWGRTDLLQLQLVGVKDQGNIAGAPLALGVLANWRTRF
jgi:hypothetical protein